MRKSLRLASDECPVTGVVIGENHLVTPDENRMLLNTEACAEHNTIQRLLYFISLRSRPYSSLSLF
jgi:hypothetical protein